VVSVSKQVASRTGGGGLPAACNISTYDEKDALGVTEPDLCATQARAAGGDMSDGRAKADPDGEVPDTPD
jgi:hypothetical protein